VHDGRVAVRHANLAFWVVVPNVTREPVLGVPELLAAQRTRERHLRQHSRSTD
jgi:hypothetical protein